MSYSHTATNVVKHSAAAALVSISLCPHAAQAGAPGFYAPPPAVHAEAPPFAAPAGYLQSRPFRWGWFGAEHFPQHTQYHRGYNGNLWSWRRVTHY